MPAIQRVRRGTGSLKIEFSRGGLPINGFTCELIVRQFTSGPVLIRRFLTPANNFTWATLLTTTEVATLKIGLWNAFGKLRDAETGEGRGIADSSVRFQVQPGVRGGILPPPTETFFRTTTSGDFRITTSGDNRVTTQSTP